MNVSKFLRLSLSAALLTSVVGMTGCGMNAKSNIRTQNVRNDQNHMRPYSTNEAGRYNAGYHHIGSMRFSSALSTQVAKLPGVRAAHVVLTDRDAYVAVRLMDNNSTSRTNSYNRSNTNSYGLNGTTDMNNMYGNRGGSIAGDIGRAGRDVGRGVVDTGRDIVGGVANTGRNVVNDIGGTGRNMMNDMTGRGKSGNTRMNSYNGTGTGTGTGMGMNRNNMNNNINNMGTNQNQVPQNVRDEITRLIKRSNKVVQNVYISSDESFMNEVEGYSTNSRDGGGVIQDTMTGFERLVNRIFPFGDRDEMQENNYRNNGINNRMNNNMNMNNRDMMDRNPSGYQNGTR